METVLTYAEYIDLLHGFAGVVCGAFFINLWLSKL
jgi:hypothetical protein